MRTIASKLTFLTLYGVGGLLILSSLLWLSGCQSSSKQLSIPAAKVTVPIATISPSVAVPATNLITKVDNAQRVVALTSLSADIIQRLSPMSLPISRGKVNLLVI